MTILKNLIGQTLGQYQIIEQIGAGGMATVFRAHQPSLNRDVALKILPPHIAERESFTGRFALEAQAIGNLHHPNILPIYDFGEDKGYGYIAMRYVPGAKTLGDWMASPLSEKQILEFTRQIASALDYAHRAGIIHRDIKPTNILMDGEWILLSDFGLAKLMAAPSGLTGSGEGLGTPAYMSPEQAQGEAIDPRTDIYSLGIILFEMLTGQIPHKAETPLAIVVKRISEPVPSPRMLNPEISPAVEAVLLKALAKRPADRFSSAGELWQALEAAFAEKSYSARPEQEDAGITMPVPKPVAAARQSRRSSAPSFSALESDPSLPGPARHPVELMLLVLLGLVGLCGLGGTILALTAEPGAGQSNLGGVPACFSLFFASLTSMGMIWFRNRLTSDSAWLTLGITCWFIGMTLFGFGGFAMLTPSDNTFAENLGFSTVFCFGPGGLLALLGLGLYAYARRRAPHHSSISGTGAAEPVRQQNDKLRRAEEYRSYIIRLIEQKKTTPFADQLALIPPKLDLWQAHLRQLIRRLDEFERNPVVQRDLREVPAAIDRLQAKLAQESDPQLRAQMEGTLKGYWEHQRGLEALTALMNRTELEVDETLANIGAIYSQLQLLELKEIDSSRAKRLSADIDEQAARLGDLLAAVDEVYQETGLS